MSYYEPHLCRYILCAQCGKEFRDDCGDVFCSGSCESQYEREHAKCERCDNEVGEDNLNSNNICENCEDEENEN